MKSLTALTVAGTVAGLTWIALVPRAGAAAAPAAGDWTIIGWNDLGMHCMDSDYEVFSILPPFNTVVAHVVDENGDLIDLPQGVTVTYHAVADPMGSINLSSAGKTNFWDHVQDFFGVALPVDHGLAGNNMPGPANVPQPMHFDATRNWFTAEGIPLTPIDDGGHSQNYPLMRLQARDANGVLRASTDVVLPISQEMDCRACHSTGAGPEAEPAAGWVGHPDFQRDYRLNILRLHDELQAANPAYASALAAVNFNSGGLYDTVVSDGKAILCAACHGSNALPGTGIATVSPLTEAIHAAHADVTDPISGMQMDSFANRASCYRCHPGSETRCLRGAMGSAVAGDGSMAMQCQSCHGTMSRVGDANRAGWFEEPACQSCHTGSATNNNGEIRYETVFDANGNERVPVSNLFATTPDTPAAGLDLYRFSDGHGGLQCATCHGSTHAIFPSAHGNDNLQSQALQGHAGTLSDCLACHDSMPNTVTGGPHGMHPIGQSWVHDHEDVAENNPGQCRACHGTDYRGSVLSRAQGDRVLNTDFGQKHFFEGYTVGCYDCHQGPDDDDANNNPAPVAQSTSASTPAGVQVMIPLSATDNNGTPTVRIVEQPQFGTVALSGNQATYFPFTGFAGQDSFTFTASDGQKEAQLATVSIDVTANWENFGEGHAGTNGVPSLTAGAAPSLGSNVPLHIGNSSGLTAPAFLLSSTRADYQPTPWGGVFLVAAPGQRVMQLPPQGVDRVFHVPNSNALIGHNIVLQLVVRDTGSSEGFAFSRGLRLTLGE